MLWDRLTEAGYTLDISASEKASSLPCDGFDIHVSLKLIYPVLTTHHSALQGILLTSVFFLPLGCTSSSFVSFWCLSLSEVGVGYHRPFDEATELMSPSSTYDQGGCLMSVLLITIRVTISLIKELRFFAILKSLSIWLYKTIHF